MPKLYRMRIFAPNEVVAKSRFWYFLKKLKRVKKANGEVVSISQVSSRGPFLHLDRLNGRFWSRCLEGGDNGRLGEVLTGVGNGRAFCRAISLTLQLLETGMEDWLIWNWR